MHLEPFRMKNGFSLTNLRLKSLFQGTAYRFWPNRPWFSWFQPYYLLEYVSYASHISLIYWGYLWATFYNLHHFPTVSTEYCTCVFLKITIFLCYKQLVCKRLSHIFSWKIVFLIFMKKNHFFIFGLRPA